MRTAPVARGAHARYPFTVCRRWIRSPRRPRARPRGFVLACLTATLAAGCGEPEPQPLFDLDEVEREFVEVVDCRHSHEHDLRHVRVFADPAAAEIFERCVLSGLGGRCDVSRFDTGALFVKYEYDLPGCDPRELTSYTASLRLDDGDFPEGRDWHWQRLTPAMDVAEDGAPARCIQCHVNHCDPPDGLDLRCLPD
jgi:hypothetical protein